MTDIERQTTFSSCESVTWILITYYDNVIILWYFAFVINIFR